MSSKSGPRATGTDGTDFKHRQTIASSIKLSLQYKFYLKILFAFHFMVLLVMWTKVGGELLFNELRIVRSVPDFWRRLDLPSAYPWEYVWCLSFLPIIFALLSFSRNKVRLQKFHYYGQFLLGILPSSIGMGSQLPELIEYIQKGESSRTPTFAGHFPMVVLWYIFFLVVFQIHGFSMYISYFLNESWSRPITTPNNIPTESKKEE